MLTFAPSGVIPGAGGRQREQDGHAEPQSPPPPVAHCDVVNFVVSGDVQSGLQLLVTFAP